MLDLPNQSTILFCLLSLLAAAPSALADPAPPLWPSPLAHGARCGFVTDCTRFDQLALHVALHGTLRTNAPRSYVDALGAVRLSLTAFDVAEAGAAFAGHVADTDTGAPRLASAPLSLFVRLRLLPLPLGLLAASSLQLAVSYQHDLLVTGLGAEEPPGQSRGTLRVIGGRALGPVEVEGSLGVAFLPAADGRLRPAALDLGAAASLWFWRSRRGAR